MVGTAELANHVKASWEVSHDTVGQQKYPIQKKVRKRKANRSG